MQVIVRLSTIFVTGQRSNQLNYVPAGGSCERMVGSKGLEPLASCL